MASDTISLSLDGEVSLPDFAAVLAHLSSLVSALSQEVAGDENISWIVSDLEAGSAVAAFRGEAAEPERVERVVVAYLHVGRALESGGPFPYSDRVKLPATRIISYLNGKITGVQFAADQESAVVLSRPDAETKSPRVFRSIGVLVGTVETLSRRQGLKFTLYDDHFDRAVTCYLRQDQEDLIRDAWGKRVQVAGAIARDPQSGRALYLNDIISLTVTDPVPQRSYKQARGALEAFRGENPEVIIRRMRDESA